jgi:hypothetical protein
MNSVSRRKVLGSIGLSAGAGLWLAFGRGPGSATQAADKPAPVWSYTHLDPDAIADDAYRLFADGGCMYGLFGAVVSGLASKLGGPFRSFPLHMMRYGAGGVGGWGSLCGTLNGAAAVVGLVEPAKKRRTQIVGDLFSWYESTALPTYAPKGHGNSASFAKSVSQSVLCHVSVHRWCEAADSEVESDLMHERCRRLTADVAAKTVDLLNRNLQGKVQFTGLAPEVKSCMSCHGKEDRADAFGTMRCNACHELSKDHPKDK